MEKHDFRNFIKKCPLTFFLIASVCILTLYAFVQTLRGQYTFHMTMEHPMFASVLMKEYLDLNTEELNPDDLINPDATSTESGHYEPSKEPEAYAPPTNDTNTPPENLTTDYPYVTVDEHYFDDAVFIGDVCIDGLKTYAGFSDADYFCQADLTVSDLMVKHIARIKKVKGTIPQVFQLKSYNKVFLMVGANDLTLGTTDEYVRAYEQNIRQLKELQPNIVIFMIGMLYVTENSSASSETINNPNIIERNKAVAALANGTDIFYLEINPAVADESGYLNPEYSWDGMHLKAEYYILLENFLLEHGVGTDICPEPQSKKNKDKDKTTEEDD